MLDKPVGRLKYSKNIILLNFKLGVLSTDKVFKMPANID